MGLNKQRGLQVIQSLGPFLWSFPDPGTTSSHKVLWGFLFDFSFFFPFYFFGILNLSLVPPSSSVYQQEVFPLQMLCQHLHVSLKAPCDLVNEGDWSWAFPTRYNSCRFYKIVHWATKSSDWGYSTNSEWQDVTETPFTTNEDFHYPQEMQKNHAFQDHRMSRSQYNFGITHLDNVIIPCQHTPQQGPFLDHVRCCTILII